mmetsp:Transcript_8078/g.24341  ORF Transcript_8078/g.24341 Transcript_8078/m.24341 type:complete len:253 (+) Transcript_8078:685-1443(+)|eukprot:CAMPEP_0198732208 /NCGR_PEP_ID=MMETSP1475-20131203/34388_1 /TAXON_ID= ORGANISM="Unidentified sp., Strain CCMP1999" /NCGR_SAMPLE_ID=MMETSP1475 /ASSEMBLY_ACC=CAM_ASM_001111 /LENGTH=252 /DNA_ID=CAMNT_0044495273 /DNA_START=649 /DNA_END=1407 /DNA_ORIENTATION=+
MVSLPHYDLWSHVAHGAVLEALQLFVVNGANAGLVVQATGQAEISQFYRRPWRVAIRQQNILRFEVSVCNVACMKVAERPEDLSHDVLDHRFRDRVASVGDVVEEVPSIKKLHHDVDKAVRSEHINSSDNILLPMRFEQNSYLVGNNVSLRVCEVGQVYNFARKCLLRRVVQRGTLVDGGKSPLSKDTSKFVQPIKPPLVNVIEYTQNRLSLLVRGQNKRPSFVAGLELDLTRFPAWSEGRCIEVKIFNQLF